MVLVDVANGRPRHVPYRDSKLTFLLQVNSKTYFSTQFLNFKYISAFSLQYKVQDSLGGNSKTMIISNVSPSIWLVLF